MNPTENKNLLIEAFDQFKPFLENDTALENGIKAITTDFKSSTELLHELTLSKNCWDSPYENMHTNTSPSFRDVKISHFPWYFRGQQDAKWGLNA